MSLVAGLILGLIGSLHCVGMCGPIVVSAYGRSGKGFFLHRILYNLGRAVTYVILGIGMGLLGRVIHLTGYQQWVSIGAGILIFLLALLYIIGVKREYTRFNILLAWIKRNMGNFLRKRGLVNDFTLGLVNGFLPCGMVYLALAGALTLSSVYESAMYMMFFGLGTLPAMVIISYVGPALGKFVNLNRWVPIMFSLLGILLIVRGLELGIPYLSPDIMQGHTH